MKWEAQSQVCRFLDDYLCSPALGEARVPLPYALVVTTLRKQEPPHQRRSKKEMILPLRLRA